MSRDRFLQRMLQRRSRTALTSGGEEPVLDSGGSGHSVFSWVFLEVLRKNRDLLEGDSLFDRIKRPVALKADQTPLYGDIRKAGQDVEQGDFVFVPKVLQKQASSPLLVQEGKRGGGNFARRGDNEQPAEQRSGRAEPVQPSSPKQGETMTDPTTGMELVYVPKGCFQMGSPPDEKGRFDDEGPVHEVCVDGFWMGKYEVTQGQWQKIMGDNPAYFQNGDKYPVESVSWEDAQKFIIKLNKKSGKEYRLPTEAEWEYAARAGTKTSRHWGDDISCDKAMYDNYSETDNCAKYVRKQGLKNGSTAPVGSYSSNQFGLHDMLGNVYEWCADWYGDYSSSSQTNSVGPSSGSYRVIRGGGWSNYPGGVRSAYRGRGTPGRRYYNLGFRLALPVQQDR
ncbi:MAG: formylglycine-generating enzyme family protein [Candidatus Electrothrix sp. AR5]|nr:formylglycine-generating enzyme family protein [Candidatus Electrothrix sp. AR5]